MTAIPIFLHRVDAALGHDICPQDTQEPYDDGLWDIDPGPIYPRTKSTIRIAMVNFFEALLMRIVVR